MAYVIGLPCVDVEDLACVEENARFFTDSLLGQPGPLGSPGGAGKIGPLDVGPARVAALPSQGEADQQSAH